MEEPGFKPFSEYTQLFSTYKQFIMNSRRSKEWVVACRREDLLNKTPSIYTPTTMF